MWSLDFQFDETADGKINKILNIVDEHTREELGGLVDRRIDADRTVTALEDIVKKRGATPGFIRCDNGTELTANPLRDWCRFSGTATSYIGRALRGNPFVESFGSRLRDGLLSTEQLDSLLEAQVLDRRLEVLVQQSATPRQPGLAVAGRVRYGLQDERQY